MFRVQDRQWQVARDEFHVRLADGGNLAGSSFAAVADHFANFFYGVVPIKGLEGLSLGIGARGVYPSPPSSTCCELSRL